MSRLTDLIRQAKEKDPALGRDLEVEVGALAGRRQFGLNFERHQPEAVEIPGRSPRRGDKVRILPPRGASDPGDSKVWRVAGIEAVRGATVAHLQITDDDGEVVETISHPADDIVVVAEFRDPIYPGLVSTDRVECGDSKPDHVVINAENFHALQTLQFTHRGKIDAIYIDPPYNTGAKDWKYNNDYVDGEDFYRHSKWLAFMERRLKIAKELLNPDDSVLIVTIDEKEYLRLGLLLEQTFPEAKIQMVSSVINPKGTSRANEFSRVDEYIYFVRLGNSRLYPQPIMGEIETTSVQWETMRRRNQASARGRKGKGACGPNQFYAIHVDEQTGIIQGRGEPLPVDFPVSEYEPPTGCVAVFPVRDSGQEINWSLTDSAFDERLAKGYVRAGKATPGKPQTYIIQYLLGGVIEDIESGRAEVTGRAADGSVIAQYVTAPTKLPRTQWAETSHSAEHGGTVLLRSLMPDRTFPFPKSLYAVEDSLRYFLAQKPEAVILDFFAGSGTTAHAVMRLNRQDEGQRQSISVTNNEVSAEEQQTLQRQGLRPGDPEWEMLGICDYITKPRIKSAITGRTPQDEPVKGAYRFNDGFPMAEGFEENVEFFTLTYESPWRVARGRAFEAIAPLLWLRAGAEGRRIDEILVSGWDVADVYGVIADLDQTGAFLEAVTCAERVRMVFIVTDDDRAFQSVCAALPERVEPVRLYESYLRNFEIKGRD